MAAWRAIRWAPVGLLLLVVGGGALLRTLGAVLVVDDDGGAAYSTIQTAIDDAVAGSDEVEVRCGTYVENVVLRDGVPVSGAGPECTFIDPADVDAPVVDIPSAGSDTVLRGFTIFNRASLWPDSTGIFVQFGTPVITRNVIEGPGPTAFSGSGIRIAMASPVISYNIIRGNHDNLWGGGVYLGAGDPVITSNLIVGNTAYYGGGIYGGYTGDVTITNNTIADNHAYIGGGVALIGDGITANNAIVFNTAVIYGGGVNDWSEGAMAFEANDLFGNTPENYSGDGAPVGADGNISAHPRFADTNDRTFAGFQPRSDSPLIDAASPSRADDLDLRGIPRPVDGNADGAALPDIGARENEGVTGFVHDGFAFTWDAGLHHPPEWNVYRGDLAVLRATGVYTQDPLTVDGARHFCDVPTGIGDSDTPPPGEVYFYLVAAHGTVEGPLGFDSTLTERPRTFACLGP